MAEDDDTKSMFTAAKNERASRPVISDLSGVKFKNLLKLGKKRGFILSDELNAVLPDEVTSDYAQDLYAMLNEMGINVIDNEDDDEPEAKTRSRLIFEMPFEAEKPSPEMQQLISDTLTRYPDAMPAAEYLAITGTLSWTDRSHFDKGLEKPNYVLTNYFDGPDGLKFAAAFSVVRRGNFQLVSLLGYANNLPILPKLGPNQISSNPLQYPVQFGIPIESDDEVWLFSAPKNSHPRHFLRGLALVRNMTVIDAYVTMRG